MCHNILLIIILLINNLTEMDMTYLQATSIFYVRHKLIDLTY